MTASPRDAVLARLALAPVRIASEARRVDRAEAASGPPPGEWTTAQVLAHLAAVERVVWQARLDSLGAGGEPSWAWTEPGPLDDPRAATTDGAAALFAEARAQTLVRLAILDEPGWTRAGVHAVYGRLDVVGLMGVAADHDDEHLAALAARATEA